MTTIEWTHGYEVDGHVFKGETWNLLVGCSKVSEGCRDCYAINHAHRLAGNPNPKISSAYAGLTERRGGRTEWTGKVNFLEQRLGQPLRWHRPRMIFVNSMSDWLHPSVTKEQIKAMWEVMHEAHQRYGHIFQLLTKRPERFSVLGPNGIGWYAADAPVPCPEPGIWLGVTTENQQQANERIPLLLQAPAAIRFLSCEPLLGPLNLEHTPSVDWVIVGGESGHKARSCDIGWIKSIVEQCKNSDISCFVKQLGSAPCGKDREDTILARRDQPFGNSGWRKVLDSKGGNPEEWPEDIRVREYPKVLEVV